MTAITGYTTGGKLLVVGEDCQGNYVHHILAHRAYLVGKEIGSFAQWAFIVDPNEATPQAIIDDAVFAAEQTPGAQIPVESSVQNLDPGQLYLVLRAVSHSLGRPLV